MDQLYLPLCPHAKEPNGVFVSLIISPSYVMINKVYGITYAERDEDPELVNKRLQLVSAAAKSLDNARMVRFVERTGFIHPTDLVSRY